MFLVIYQRVAQVTRITECSQALFFATLHNATERSYACQIRHYPLGIGLNPGSLSSCRGATS